jgi:hypothetical protein
MQLHNKRVNELLAQAILRCTGRYTSPHTWGVYRISPSAPSSTKRFRSGNHPVREQELRREFGNVECLALFTSAAQARELADIYNTAA